VVVDDYEPGEGRHKGRVGALWVKLSTGVKCKVGTGLKDRDRDNPPPKGSVITVKYQELTEDGALRFPVFAGVRTDGDPTAPPPTRKMSKSEKGEAPAPKPQAQPVPVPASAPAPAASSPSPVSIGGPTMATMTKKRYFEFAEGSSSKFWEVWLDGSDVVTQWGKIGTPGRETRKSFPDAAKAQKEYDKLLAEKTGKGYVEKDRPE
jgi:DNA ligase-1